MAIARQLQMALLLAQNAALPALGVIGYCHIRSVLQRRLRPRAELLLMGVVFGILGACSVLGSIDAGDGVRLDLRNAVAVVSTTFGGIEAGAATTLIIGLSRVALGGKGVPGGLVSLTIVFALSAANLVMLRQRGAAADHRSLTWLGLAATIAGVAVMPLFPGPVVTALVLPDIALAWVILMPLTIVFLGATLLHFERSLAVGRTLQEKEHELGAILDNAPVAIFLKDRQARYQVVNRCYADWTGHGQKDLHGRSSSETFPSAVAGSMERTDREVLDHGRVTQTEFTTGGLNCPPSGIAHALVIKFPIRDGSGAIVGLAGFGLDASERKQAEEALRRSEERFRALIEYSADAIAVVQPDGTMTYRGPSRSAKQLGYDEDEIVGGVRIIDRMHPDDAGAFGAMLEDVARAPGGVATGRSRIRHQDGSWRYMAWSARNAIGIPGIDGIVVNCHDVTKSVNLELQLMQAQKMEAVGQLASGVAHDFHNIIGAILGFAGFLIQDLPESAPQHRFAHRIVSAATAAQDLLRQILAFSRTDGVDRKPYELARLMLESSDLLRASLPSSTRLELVPPVEGVVAVVNAAQITQILLNLCLNANDALMGKPGSVTIELSRVVPGDIDYALFVSDGSAGAADAVASDGRVVAGMLRHDRSYAAFTVRDTGSGMEQRLLERIFEPFFTTKEHGYGTGLGLAVVHGTIMAYEGACLVTSRPGAGSIFKVYLPAARTGTTPAPLLPAPPTLFGRESVLIVGEDSDTTHMLTVGLDRLGYEVVALSDPEEALAVFVEEPDAWDVVISLKGLALLDWLKAVRPSARFILCSGHNDGITKEMALARGIDAFLLKPVSPDQLAAAIRRLIAGAATVPRA